MQDTVTISIFRFKELEQAEEINKNTIPSAYININMNYRLLGGKLVEYNVDKDKNGEITAILDKTLKPAINLNEGLESKVNILEVEIDRVRAEKVSYELKYLKLDKDLNKIPNWIKRLFI